MVQGTADDGSEDERYLDTGQVANGPSHVSAQLARIETGMGLRWTSSG